MLSCLWSLGALLTPTQMVNSTRRLWSRKTISFLYNGSGDVGDGLVQKPDITTIAKWYVS